MVSVRGSVSRWRAAAGSLLLLCALPVGAQRPSLTFEDAVARALTANNQLLTQEHRMRVAELDRHTANAVLSPQFRSFMNSDARWGAEVGSQYGLVMDQQFASGANFGVGYYNNTFGDRSLSELRFNYTLPFFGSRGAEIRRSLDDADFKLNQEAARLRLTELEVRREVLKRYYDVALASTQVALAQSAASIAEKSSEALQIRFDGGQASRLQVRRAGMSAAQARHGLSRATQALRLAEDQLRVAIGAPLDEPMVVETSAPPDLDLQLVELSLGALIDRAKQERLEVIEAGRAVSEIRGLIRDERPSLLPNMEVSLQYALVNDEGYASGSIEDQRFGIGIRMNTDFSREARNQTDVRRRLDLQERERTYIRVRQMVEMDVKRAHAQAEDYLQQLMLSREAASLAEDEYRRGQIMAENGALDLLELLQLEQQVNESRHQVRASEVAHAAALYDLQLAAGGSAP